MIPLNRYQSYLVVDTYKGDPRLNCKVNNTKQFYTLFKSLYNKYDMRWAHGVGMAGKVRWECMSNRKITITLLQTADNSGHIKFQKCSQIHWSN